MNSDLLRVIYCYNPTLLVYDSAKVGRTPLARMSNFAALWGYQSSCFASLCNELLILSGISHTIRNLQCISYKSYQLHKYKTLLNLRKKSGFLKWTPFLIAFFTMIHENLWTDWLTIIIVVKKVFVFWNYKVKISTIAYCNFLSFFFFKLPISSF